MTLIPRDQAAGRTVVAFGTFGSPQRTGAQEDLKAAEPASQATTEMSELALMAERIDSLEGDLERERNDGLKAREAAFEAGREEGKAQAESDASERLAILRDAIGRAAAEVAEGIDRRGDLAVAIARAALAKMFGEEAPFGAMVEAIVRYRLAQTDADMVLGVRVSANDFADETALAALSIEHGGLRVSRDAKLPAGACLFDLTLGTIDASVALQAKAVDTLLAASGGTEQ